MHKQHALEYFKITPYTTINDLKKQRNDLLKQYHPDVYKLDDSEIITINIIKAYEFLVNELKNSKVNSQENLKENLNSKEDDELISRYTLTIENFMKYYKEKLPQAELKDLNNIIDSLFKYKVLIYQYEVALIQSNKLKDRFFIDEDKLKSDVSITVVSCLKNTYKKIRNDLNYYITHTIGTINILDNDSKYKLNKLKVDLKVKYYTYKKELSLYNDCSNVLKKYLVNHMSYPNRYDLNNVDNVIVKSREIIKDTIDKFYKTYEFLNKDDKNLNYDKYIKFIEDINFTQNLLEL